MSASDQPPVRQGDVLYFCDESSHVTDSHMAVGGLAIDRKTVAKVAAHLKKLRGNKSEIKWSNANWNGGRTHKAYIDFLDTLRERNIAHLHIRFAPFNEYDHSISGPRKRTDTVSKMYYQLILHRPVKLYGQTRRLHIHPDDGECTSDLPRLKDAFHHDSAKWADDLAWWDCIQTIQPRPSITEPMLQLLDVSLGALASFRNGRHCDGKTGPIKRELAEYAIKQLKIKDITKNLDTDTLSIWNVRPKWKRK